MQLKVGEWHIPFGDIILDGSEDKQKFIAEYKQQGNVTKYAAEEISIKVATARCARVSYTVVGEEGKAHDYAKDIELHDRLAVSGHWSPFEHCARAMNHNEADSSNGYPGVSMTAKSARWSGNFQGFVQYRKTFANENIVK